MKEDQNIEDLFRASFEQFEVTPPSSVKTAIDSEIRGGKRKRIWWISSAILLLLLATGGWFLFGTAESGTTKQSASVKNPEEIQQPVSAVQHSSASAPKEVAASGEQPIATKHYASKGTTDQPKSSQEAPVFAKKKEQQKEIQPKNKRPKSTWEYKDYKTKKKFPNKGKNTLPVLPTDNVTTVANTSKSGSISIEKEVNGNPSLPIKNSGKAGVHELQLPVTAKLSEKAVALRKKEPQLAEAKEDANVATNSSGSSDDDDKNETTDNNWLVSVFAGPQWGINAITKDPAFDFKEKTSLYFSAEINRNLLKGFGVTTGAGFNARTETMSYNQFSYDSVYVGTDSLPVYGNPNIPDSITGYTYFDVYNIDTTKTQQLQTNTVQTVAIPLFVTRHFSFSEQWGMLVNAGAVFRFNSFKTGNAGPAPTTHAFTLSPAIRVHFTYTTEKWMFSLGISGGIDLKQALIYEGFDRKRSYLTPQFGVHFRF